MFTGTKTNQRDVQKRAVLQKCESSHTINQLHYDRSSFNVALKNKPDKM